MVVFQIEAADDVAPGAHVARKDGGKYVGDGKHARAAAVLLVVIGGGGGEFPGLFPSQHPLNGCFTLWGLVPETIGHIASKADFVVPFLQGSASNLDAETLHLRV